MRIRAAALSVVCLVAVLAGSSGVSSAPTEPQRLEGPVALTGLATAVRLHPPQPQVAQPSPADTVIALVNGERAKWGLAPLVRDSRLDTAAQRHSEDQAAMGVMTHTGSNGSNAGQRISAAGFSWRRYAENVAFGYSDAAAVVDAWMKSPGHRDNILSVNTHVGVGLAFSGGGTPYWTLKFAVPA